MNKNKVCHFTPYWHTLLISLFIWALCWFVLFFFSSMQVPCWTETCELWTKSWQAQHYHTQQFSAGVKSLGLLWSHCFCERACVSMREWLNNLPLLLPLCASIHPARPLRLKKLTSGLFDPASKKGRKSHVHKRGERVNCYSQPTVDLKECLTPKKKKTEKKKIKYVY